MLTIGIDAGTGAITDLITHGITLRFDSTASVQEAAIELRLMSGDREMARAGDILPDTPCRLAGDHPIWEDLLTNDVVERLLDADAVDLVVTVDGLARETFSFERVTAPFEWVRDARGQIEARDEAGELSLFAVKAAEPLVMKPGYAPTGDADIALIRAGRDEPLQGGGYCLTVPRIGAPTRGSAASPRPAAATVRSRRRRGQCAHGRRRALLVGR